MGNDGKFHMFTMECSSFFQPISLLRCQEPGGRPRGVWWGRTAPGDAKQGENGAPRWTGEAMDENSG